MERINKDGQEEISNFFKGQTIKKSMKAKADPLKKIFLIKLKNFYLIVKRETNGERTQIINVANETDVTTDPAT